MSKTTDAFTLPGGSPPEIRLFSPFQIGVATFLGNVFAGGALLAINYWRLDKSGPAWVTIVSSAILAIGTLFAVVVTNILVWIMAIHGVLREVRNSHGTGTSGFFMGQTAAMSLCATCPRANA